ncbi:STAS domain-containing protein [Streptomyces sp. TRM S81-3]|uniref:STAS domain-containing protein n=1 Tax=Streptomyces griseicoloratus TaxID=2752516 RepID=A0A926KWS4_9ACTN|nr:STAS domain-containing protein [Streptomyces griseicoloratus]MBD0417650.1 STAS domain-containing protein [Streptomyces griseicoloratus]
MGTQHETRSGATRAPGLTVSPLAGRRGVRAAGEVGLSTHGTWRRALEQAVREGPDSEGEDVYHLELSAVTFVDVAGAGVLVAAAERLPDGRRLVLHRPPPALRRVLEMFWPDVPAIEVSMS